jgi:MFS family permease
MSNAVPRARPGLMVAMTCLIQVVGGGLGWSSLPPLMPTIASELSISHAMDGLIWGSVPLGLALFAIPAGAAIDRYGARRVGFIAVLVSAALCGARGLLHSAWSLAAVMFAFGIMTAFQTPTIPKILAEHVPPERLGWANGWGLLALALGQALVMLAASTILAPLFGGWRRFQVTAGIAMAVAAVLWLLLVRDRVRHSEGFDFKEVLVIARDGQMVRLTIVFFLQFGGYLVMFGLLPRALEESGLSAQAAALWVAVWLAAVGLCNFVGAWWSDKVGRRRPFIVWGSLVCSLSLAAMAVLPVQASVWMLILAGIASGVFGTLLWVIPAEMPALGPEKMGAAIGFMLVFSQVATFLLAVATGAVADAGGLKLALVVLSVVHILILLPARKLRETGRAAEA